MIDFHVHLGNCFRDEYPQRTSLTVEQLIDRMNREGIKISVLLPLESPEVQAGYFLTEQAIEARDLYPERLIAFAGVDPRQQKVAQQLDVFINRYGCRGYGELLNPLPFDHELNKVIYGKCDEYGLPIVFEINAAYCYDEAGLPRLERCLREFPNAIFVGHGPGFWSAISGDDDRRGGYPSGPVTAGGALDRLLEKYDNLYCDLSARSGYNAMTRDPEFAAGFIERHWQRLLWATDYFIMGQELPQVEWLAQLDVEPHVREAIGSGNARRVLGLQ